MKALVFAAGLGTRLRPLTDTVPKALIPFRGKPLLEHLILKLKGAGFDEVMINVHYLADQIIEFLHDHDNFGIRIEISDERKQLLDTGGGLRKASWFFDDGKPFLIHNADIFSDLDLAAFYNRAVGLKGAATLLVSERVTSRYLLFDHECELKGWINEQTGETRSPYSHFEPFHLLKYAFGGVHLFSPELFDELNKVQDPLFSIVDFYLSVCDRRQINALPVSDMRWIDIGKIDSLKRLEEEF